MTTEKLTSLLQRRARLDEQIAAARRAESESARKADARRKIVVGAALLSAARQDPRLRKLLVETLGRVLGERDLALFATGDPGAGDLVLGTVGSAALGPIEGAAEGGWIESGHAG
ncbi:hypothetical protein [Azospirillum thermophilum]|uniref:Mobilization protein n=1 Tax=Azospirillum thermophilum TaxID=2202148 RepID=A0A2S2CKQ4_9PROT|nr:hypothetical protein [Azospirillum thermophilum]AWK85009.1 hypothetical protein DEW08_01380 [Azospirillum thermophilum]